MNRRMARLPGKTVEQHLAIHPFLRGMNDSQVAAIAECASLVRFPSGEIIFRAGSEADTFFLVRTGMVSLEVAPDEHHPRIIQMLREGDVLGWSWLFQPRTWAFDARAQTPVQAIAIEADCLRERCDRDHHLGYELLLRIASIMADRLQATRSRLLDLTRPI